MPRIELYDVRNMMHTIVSADRELISRWLGEMVQRLGPEAAGYHLPLKIQIWPWFDGEGKPDWCADSRVVTQRYDLNKDGLQRMLDDLKAAGIDVPETTGGTA